MPATAPMPAEVRIVPRRRPSRGAAALAVLAVFAVVVLVLNVLPSGAAPRHATRPAPPPAVKVTVGQLAYSCTVIPRKH